MRASGPSPVLPTTEIVNGAGQKVQSANCLTGLDGNAMTRPLLSAVPRTGRMRSRES